MIKPFSKLGVIALLCGLLLVNLASNAAESTSANLISVTNPTLSYGVRIGDKLDRKIVLHIPAPAKIVESTLPKKGNKNDGVELVAITTETEQVKAGTRYTFNLSYQTFAGTSKPLVMQLPALQLSLTNVQNAEVIEVPSWGFWLSPMVTGGIQIAEKNIQPEIMPPLIDVSAHKTRFVIFASVFAFSLLALLYLNADGNWLPFMGGAFAKAHRKLKRLAKASGAKSAVEEKQALVFIHQAFNQHFGANMFARDIDAFIAKHTSFKKLKAEITQFFNESNQSLYAVAPRDSQKIITDLALLSKHLRDCERGV